MDWQNLNPGNFIVAAAASSFIVGLLLGCLARKSARSDKSGEAQRDHLIRQLEADLRVAQRRLEEYSVQLDSKSEQIEQSMATVHDLNSLLETRNTEVDQLRQDVKGAVKKTHELRRELTQRAEETLREHVRAQEAQTELDVVKAGSDAIVSEFTRIQEDKNSAAKDPTQADMLLDDSLLEDSSTVTDG